MKKLFTPIIPILGILIPIVTIMLGPDNGSIDYFFQPGSYVVFYFSSLSIFVSVFLIGAVLILWSLVRIKNFHITKWILFSLSGLLLVVVILFVFEEYKDELIEAIIFIVPGLLFAAIMILSLLIKKKLWTKILLIVSVSIVIIVLAIGLIANERNNSNSKGWKHTAAILEDSNQTKSRIYLQGKKGIERYIYTNRVFPGIYKYQPIDPISIPNKKWEVLSKQHLGEIKLSVWVKSREEFEKAISSEKYGTYILNYKINLLGNCLVQNQDNIIISGFNKDGEPKGIISSSSIPIKNCHHITLRGLTFSGGLEFQNCSNITIENCIFEESKSNSAYFYEDCDSINIRNCSFNKYNKYAINAPFVSVDLSSNQYAKGNGNEDQFFRVNIRGFFNNYGWDLFYKKLVCNSYNFSSDNEVNYFDDCSFGTYTGLIITDDWYYRLNNLFSESIESLSFSRYMHIDYLRMLSGGIDPTLRKPFGKKYASKKDLPVFSYYNPKFIEYWMGRMIPAPNEFFGSQTFQILYNNSFRYHAQVLTESYMVLNSNYEVETEVAWYIEESKKGGWEFPEELNSKYKFIPRSDEFAQIYNLDYIGSNDYLRETTGSLIGFWIRREIDGTDELLFENLIKVIKEYDQSYYSWLLKEFDI